MPIYDYGCGKCGHKFEKLVKLNAPIPACPECGTDDVKKLVSPSGFLLKGSGWYRDHYGLKSSATDSSSGGGSSDSGGGE